VLKPCNYTYKKNISTFDATFLIFLHLIKKQLHLKKIVLFLITAFCFNTVIAQNNAIKITNVNTNKEKIIKENRRIKLKTTDGQKIKGRFKVENNNTIIIDNVRINLTDIDELKRNPLLTSILVTGFLVYGGVITLGFSVLVGVLADSSAFWLTIPAAGMIYTGIKAPNFNKNHKMDKGWKFELISIPD
jgi:hypothetical protein